MSVVKKNTATSSVRYFRRGAGEISVHTNLPTEFRNISHRSRRPLLKLPTNNTGLPVQPDTDRVGAVGSRTRRGAPRTPSGQLRRPMQAPRRPLRRHPRRGRPTPHTPSPIFFIYTPVLPNALARLWGPKDLEKFLTATTFLFWTHCDQELASFHDGVTWLVVFGVRLPKPVQVAD